MVLYSDVENIQSGIGDKIAIFLQYFSTFIASFLLGFAINWKLALVVSVTFPVLSVMGAILTKVNLIFNQFTITIDTT